MELLKGDFVRVVFPNNPAGTTREMIQRAVLDVTGVEIPLERISLSDRSNTAMLSLDTPTVVGLLHWSFQPPTIPLGTGFLEVLPMRKFSLEKIEAQEPQRTEFAWPPKIDKRTRRGEHNAGR